MSVNRFQQQISNIIANK